MNKALPAGYLAKKGGQWRPVKLVDLVTLLYCVYAGSEDPEVGFEDTQRTMDMLVARLNKMVLVDPTLLESALWSASLLNERNKFWDAKGRTLDELIKDVLGGEALHLYYHYIKTKD